METRQNTNQYKKRARQEGVTYGAIYKRMRNEKASHGSGKKKRGRPPVTDVQDDIFIQKRAKRLKTKSARDHAWALRKYRRRSISPRTVINRLLSVGLKSKWQRKKPLLTQSHRGKRLLYAHQNAGRDWKGVLFSDETSIWLGQRRKRVRASSGVCPTCPTVKYPPKLNIWACISYFGPGQIYNFRENMTGELYKTILEKVMLPSAYSLFPDARSSSWVFQQDRDPKHTSKKCQRFLADKGVRVLWNPPQSPDLNCIENIWATLKDQVAERCPKNLNQLETVVQEVWAKLKMTHLRSLINSMPRRLEEVIKNDGGHIKY